MRNLMLSAALLAGWAASLAAAEKPVGPVRGEDEYLVLTASAHIDKAAVANALGQDPGMDLIVLEVKFAPRGDNKLTIDLDDFTLISRKDGQRSQPLAPSQIAGRGALVVVQGSRGGGGGGILNNSRGPIWGGTPGTGTRPQRLGGDDVAAVSGPTESKATVDAGAADKDNPLLAVLKQKALPAQPTNEPVTGLLYFFFEGKHKLKDIELMYKSPAGRMMLDFQK